MKIIGIIGSRRRNNSNDYRKVHEAFLEIYEEGDCIVSGGCPSGADRFAEKIAKRHGIPITIYYPDWQKYGKVAGLIRNSKIAQQADILIACVAEDRQGGTEDTITKFRKYRAKGKLILI